MSRAIKYVAALLGALAASAPAALQTPGGDAPIQRSRGRRIGKADRKAFANRVIRNRAAARRARQARKRQRRSRR